MPTKPATERQAPPPARVPGNLWTEIEAPALGALQAEAPVSVIVAGEDPEGHLPLTVAALSAQSYPAHLTELVLVEASARERDFSAHAPELAVTHASSPEAASGEVLCFVAAGSIPAPALVEAHARWHHAVSDAVSVGRSPRIEAGSLSAAAVAEAARAGTLAELLEERLRDDDHDEALQAYLERTRGLTERQPDLFRVAAHDNVALRRDTYRAAGGLAAAPDDGLARLDLAFRLESSGCVFVPEPEALSYRPYPADGVALATHADDGHGALAADARVASLIPVAGFRPRGSRRLQRRPAMVVNVPVGSESAEEVLETVDAILAGRFSDLELRLQVEDSHPERELIAEAVASDPRVALAPHSAAGRCESPLQVTFPAVAVPDERTFDDLHELMSADPIGALHVTVPGEPPRNAMVEVLATGPLARARRLAEYCGEPWEVVLGRLFGERWISGVEVSLRRRGAPEPHVTEHGPLAPATDLGHERTQHLRNRARADNLQARADRLAERAARERMRAYVERLRADRLEDALAETGPPPLYWRLRPGRRLLQAIRARRG